jgi:hypothetical protein
MILGLLEEGDVFLEVDWVSAIDFWSTFVISFSLWFGLFIRSSALYHMPHTCFHFVSPCYPCFLAFMHR